MQQSQGIYVVGAGGHGKVVISTLQETGQPIAGVLDDNPGLQGQSLMGIPVVGPSSLLARHAGTRAILAIGDNTIRRNISSQYPSVEWITLIHPRAYVHPSVKLGRGTVVIAGAIIHVDSRIGAHVILNTGATVDHDCRIGDHVHIAPGAHLAGNVSIGNGAFIGIGVSVIPGVTIGRQAIIGAGASVVRDIPANLTALGVPARPTP